MFYRNSLFSKCTYSTENIGIILQVIKYYNASAIRLKHHIAIKCHNALFATQISCTILDDLIPWPYCSMNLPFAIKMRYLECVM